MMLKQRTKTAYAIVAKNGSFALFDARLPLYWRRSVAKREMAERGYENAKIVRVTIELDA